MFEGTRRLVLVEIAVEVDLVANPADLPSLRSRTPMLIHASGTCGSTSRVEELLDVLPQRHILGVAEFRVGLGVPLVVGADLGGLVALRQGRQDRLEDGAGGLSLC